MSKVQSRGNNLVLSTSSSQTKRFDLGHQKNYNSIISNVLNNVCEGQGQSVVLIAAFVGQKGDNNRKDTDKNDQNSIKSTKH